MAAIDSHLAMERRAAGDCHPTLCGDDCEDDNHGDHTGHDEFVVNAEEEEGLLEKGYVSSPLVLGIVIQPMVMIVTMIIMVVQDYHLQCHYMSHKQRLAKHKIIVTIVVVVFLDDRVSPHSSRGQ